jgi:hypothetical protein
MHSEIVLKQVIIKVTDDTSESKIKFGIPNKKKINLEVITK